MSFGGGLKNQEEVQYREQLKTLQTNMINMCLELTNLLRLSKRLSYYCPIDYVSEPFFILYATHKKQVGQLKDNLISMLDEDDKILSETDDELDQLSELKGQLDQK